jgi:hypothetical protein
MPLELSSFITRSLLDWNSMREASPHKTAAPPSQPSRPSERFAGRTSAEGHAFFASSQVMAAAPRTLMEMTVFHGYICVMFPLTSVQ